VRLHCCHGKFGSYVFPWVCCAVVCGMVGLLWDGLVKFFEIEMLAFVFGLVEDFWDDGSMRERV